MIFSARRFVGSVCILGMCSLTLTNCGNGENKQAGDGDGDGPGDGDGDTGDSTSGTSTTEGSNGGSSSSNTGDGDGAGGSTLGGGGEGLGSGGGDPGAPTECNDGKDNDGDGLADYALDPGCYGPGDHTESAGTRAEEDGFTTWEFGDESVLIYVSNEGDDGFNGSSPQQAIKTLGRAGMLTADRSNTYILLRRGDVWRDETLGRFKSGAGPNAPLVLASYGESLELPRIEVASHFINLDGQERNYIQFIGLHLVSYPNDPEDPDFTGEGGGLLRLVAEGTNLLLEGCHLEYGEILLQGIQGSSFDNVELRANVIEKSYRQGTCVEGDPNGNSSVRPQGIYGTRVHGLLMEGNLFDHNGWNKDVDDACATIYNHNVYLETMEGVDIHNNVFTRSSSIHVKLRSNESGGMKDVSIADNYFTEGEIGVSIGESGEQEYRFVNAELRRNVFSDIGRSRPTTRRLAWGVDIQDNDGLQIVDNLFLNQYADNVDNSYGVHVGAPSEADVNIENNLFYRLQNRSLWVEATQGHTGVLVQKNQFVDPSENALLIDHSGSINGYTYESNEYFSSRSGGWLRYGGDSLTVAEWAAAVGEENAQTLAAPQYPDADRTMETYAGELGLDASIEGFLSEARLQSRLRFYPELTATRLNGYVREGFGRD